VSDERPSARFLYQPRWILSHLFVLVVIVAFVNLGFWQLRRLDEKRDANRLVSSRLEQPAVPIEDLPDLGDAARFAHVIVRGRYAGDEVRVLNRTLDGFSGQWAAGTVVLRTGDRVIVSRGFEQEQLDSPSPPEGEVTIEGFVIPRKRLDRPAKVDLAEPFAAQHVLPVLVQRIRSSPAESDRVTVVPPPALGEGPHFGYAIQWFIFATVALVGYPLAVRRIVARRGKEAGDTSS
jgi:cytochrome oxidase assembly protein ShyY1